MDVWLQENKMVSDEGDVPTLTTEYETQTKVFKK